MYDPTTARFLSKDPIEEKSGSTNFYLYCSNDPVNRIDPSGAQDIPDGEMRVARVLPEWFTKYKKQFGTKEGIDSKTFYNTIFPQFKTRSFQGGDPFERLDLIHTDDEEGIITVDDFKVIWDRIDNGSEDSLKFLNWLIKEYEKQHPTMVAENPPVGGGMPPAQPTGAKPPMSQGANPMAPAAAGGPAMTNPVAMPQPAADASKIQPFEFDYHYKNPELGFVKNVPLRPMVSMEQAAAEKNAEVIWNGQSGFLTKKGTDTAKYLKDARAWLLDLEWEFRR